MSVRGGPADGLTVGRGGIFRWIDPARGRGFTASGPGRSLYRLRGEVYEHVGPTAAVCTSCGAVTMDRTRTPYCHLCGGRTTGSTT